jgi:hypothetical protein
VHDRWGAREVSNSGSEASPRARRSRSSFRGIVAHRSDLERADAGVRSIIPGTFSARARSSVVDTESQLEVEDIRTELDQA